MATATPGTAHPDSHFDCANTPRQIAWKCSVIVSADAPTVWPLPSGKW